MVKWQDVRQNLIVKLEENGIQDAVLEADLLFELITKTKALRQREYIFTDEQESNLQLFLERRIAGYPIQYLFKEWQFLDFSVQVGPGVLIPRQDTEIVCEKAIFLGNKLENAPENIIDLCSGSGVIAIAMKKAFPIANVAAVEKEEDAFFYLKKNTQKYKVVAKQADVFFYQEELGRETIDIIVSNPPYLTAEDMENLQKELTYEPAEALFGGEDGLLFYKHITSAYFPCLKKGGVLVFEIGNTQKEAVVSLCEQAGFAEVGSEKDYSGNDRCVWAIK